MGANLMPTILRRLPFFADATTLRIPDGPAINISHDQIVVWVSLGSSALPDVPTGSQQFPALLDLGFNGSFLLREDHINQWLKLKLDEMSFPFLRAVKIGGESVPTFEASVWLHANVPGFRDQLDSRPAFRLELAGGVIICPTSMSRFHLPLLGVSALRKNRLRMLVNGEKRHISLRSPLPKD
jgi:hypothetical protein